MVHGQVPEHGVSREIDQGFCSILMWRLGSFVWIIYERFGIDLMFTVCRSSLGLTSWWGIYQHFAVQPVALALYPFIRVSLQSHLSKAFGVGALGKPDPGCLPTPYIVRSPRDRKIFKVQPAAWFASKATYCNFTKNWSILSGIFVLVRGLNWTE